MKSRLREAIRMRDDVASKQHPPFPPQADQPGGDSANAASGSAAPACSSSARLRR